MEPATVQATIRTPGDGSDRAVVFGRAERPLVGRLHVPVGPAKGSAIVCPPWGYENVGAYPTLRTIANRLAADGLEVLRFDYDGTGASWGEETEPGRVDAWIDSARAAASFMVQRGFERPVLVGLRLGATIATIVAAERAFAGLVAWDPIVNGRRFVRSLRAMQHVSGVGANAATGVSAAGATLTDDALDALEKLDLVSLTSCATASALMIGRREGDEAAKLRDALDQLGVGTTLENPPGTTELLDVGAEEAVEPTEIVELIVEWTRKVAAVESSDESSRPNPEPPASEASFTSPVGPGGTTWREIHRRTDASGLCVALHLPDRRITDGVVVLVNNGIARNIGPGGAWVVWARHFAALGIATVRVDLSGLGDSARRAETPGGNYPIGALDDLREVASMIEGYGLGPIALGGVCSGAYVAIDAAVHLDHVAGVFAVNGQYWFWPDPPGVHDPTRRAARRTPAWFQRVMRTRGGWKVDNTLPSAGWWLFDVLRWTPRPSRMIDRARARTAVRIVYGTDDEGIVRFRQRDPAGLRELMAGPQAVIVTCDGLDHSMFDPVHRDEVEQMAREFFRSVLPLHN